MSRMLTAVMAAPAASAGISDPRRAMTRAASGPAVDGACQPQDRPWITASAAVASEELLADFLRVLGPDHPSTLTTRGHLAYWREQTGQA